MANINSADILNIEFLQICNTLAMPKKLYIGYSGGADSSALLHLCKTVLEPIGHEIIAIHVHDAISPNADLWAQHCQDICNNINIKYHVIKTTPLIIKKTQKLSLEDAARQERFKAFAKIMARDSNNAALLLAHHADDAVETVLLRLLRGSGILGLSGMDYNSSYDGIRVMHPLLKINKDLITDYIKENQIKTVYDETNHDIKLTRNYLRHNIMPKIKAINPQYTTVILRSADLCRDAFLFIQYLIKTNFDQYAGSKPGSLSIKALCSAHSYLRDEIIRYWLRQLNLRLPDKAKMEILFNEVILAEKYSAKLKIYNYFLRKYQDDLLINIENYSNKSFILKDKIIWNLNKDNCLVLPNGVLQVIKTNNINIARVDVFIGSHGEKAKKLFQQAKIPSWERHNYPLIFLQEELIAIANLWHSAKPKYISLKFSFVANA